MAYSTSYKINNPSEPAWLSDDFRFNSHSSSLKKIFGRKTYKITIDAGFTCPNRDGTVAVGGCTYCNNAGFSPANRIYRSKPNRVPEFSVTDQIEESLERVKKRYRSDKFIAYFQSYSNTYAGLEHLRQLYEEALAHPAIVGLAIGTRPDCIDEEKLDYMQQLATTNYVSIEYGCESVYDRTLEWINRAHDYECFKRAVIETANRGIHICAHLILGFPTETRRETVAMASELSTLPIDSIKLHNLHIVKNTKLARIYQAAPFMVYQKDEYVELVSDFIEKLAPHVSIERLYGDAPSDMMIAPTWSVTGSEMTRLVNAELERRNSYQGRLWISAQDNI